MVICAFGLFKRREIEISPQFENGLWHARIRVYYMFYWYWQHCAAWPINKMHNEAENQCKYFALVRKL